ncbi:ABC transporter substrate-binding protein [Inediibacterium massiliense]|uniref:ABC transporter substrate-binding protein n=1 Tax=Inediibacterium massiliense TaxID=1658111 RepID=UPI0006B64A6B|nr:ABC transporter substrate-binding protein [Inediibacterium massiliense]
MNNKYFDRKDSLYEITQRYNEAIDLLISIGFENIKDENQRKTFGKAISLENALKIKKINVDHFEQQLIERIESNQNNSGEVFYEKDSNKEGSLKIAGVLPCPVRVPLTEAFDHWLYENKEKFNLDIDYELKAASMGLDWLKESITDHREEGIPDLFISAGFDMFFDEKLFGKFKSQNVFEDFTGFEHYNKDFDNEYITLKDPQHQYSMLGVVPAVFLVNTEELGERNMPKSWGDLLSDEFENSVSLPVGDLDLFNSILLNIFKTFGEKGVKKLGQILQKSMHPSEMVKSHMKKSEKPVVTIMPYFFTWMVKEGGPMSFVWPEDGAIISPIFMLTKKNKKEQLKPIVDFFGSKQVGEILSHNGKFPSIHPEVDNRISKNNKYMWLGWDYIKSNDISLLIHKCEEIFNKVVNGDDQK